MLKNISTQTFAGILTSLMEEKDIDINSLSIICAEEGKKISSRSIYRYKTGEHVPSLETCVFILKCLDEEASIEEIANCLVVSKDFRDTLKYNRKKLQLNKNITIKFDEFNLDIDPEQLLYLITNKANKKYPELSNAFSLYIRDLLVNDIKKDLPKNTKIRTRSKK